MPDLPRIFAQPGDSFQRHIPETSPATFGSQFFGELAQATQKIGESQDLLSLQRMVEQRDTVYQQHHNDMLMNPDSVNNLKPDEFMAAWKSQQAEDDTAALDSLPFNLKNKGQIFLSRLGKQEFDKAFGNYNKAFIDRQQGDYESGKEFYKNKAINATNDQDRLDNVRELDAFIQNAEHHRIIDYKQGEKDRIDLFHNRIPEGIAQQYINNYDFGALEKFRNSDLYKNMSPDGQARVDQKEQRAYNRMNNEAYGANVAADNAWMNKNLDAIIQNKDAAHAVQDFMEQNKQWMTAADVIYMRKRIPQLLGTEKEDSSAKSAVLDRYEQGRLPLKGLTTQGLAAKTLKEIHEAGLDAKSTADASRQVMQDLERAEQIKQSQASFAQSQAGAARAIVRFNETQARSDASNVIRGAFDPTKMSAADKAAYQNMMLDRRLNGGQSMSNDINSMIDASVLEAQQTQGDAKAIARRKILEFKKQSMPPVAPRLDPTDQQILDTLKSLRK